MISWRFHSYKIDLMMSTAVTFQIFLFTSCLYYSESQFLSVCIDKNDGDPCLLSCQTSDVNQDISISKSPNYHIALGTCLIGGTCVSADNSRYNVTQIGTNTNLEILAFSKSDNATWRCEYTGNPPNDKFLSWSKLPTSITELSGLTSNETITDELTISIEVGCLYSLQVPKTKLQLMCNGALVTSYDMSSNPSTTVCSDPDLSAYISNYTITSNPPSQGCNSGSSGYSLKAVVNLDGTTRTYGSDIFGSYRVSFESLKSTSRFESSSKLESTSTYVFVESSAGISPTDISQLNTLDNTDFPTDAADLSSSIYSSDRNHANSPFETETFGTAAENTNSSIGPNSLFSSMGLSHILDSYKTSIELTIRTETLSSFTVTIENGYMSTSSFVYSDNFFSEFTMGFLKSELYITTTEISSASISALEGSFSANTKVYPMITHTVTVITSTTSSEMLFVVSEGIETTAITAAHVLTRDSLSNDIPVLRTTFYSFTTSETGSLTDQLLETLISSTAMSYSLTSISEELGSMSSFTLEAPRSTITVLNKDLYESMPSSNLLYQNTSVNSLPSEKIQTYSQSSSETSLDEHYPISNLISSLSTHERPLLNTNDESFYNTGSNRSLDNSSLVDPNVLLSTISASSNHINSISNSQYIVSNLHETIEILSSKNDGFTSNVFGKADFSETLSDISMSDTVKHISDYGMFSSVYEQTVSFTQKFIQNSELSSLPIETFIQSSSIQKNEAESTYNESNKSHTTHLFSSILDDITKAMSASSDETLIQSTSSEYFLPVTSRLVMLVSFTREIDYSTIISASFVAKIKKSLLEMTTEFSSLGTFSSDVKRTTTMKYSLSESSKDVIFVSATGTIGVLILFVFFALVVKFLKNSKYKNDEKKDKKSNGISWTSNLGMNKGFMDRDFSFSGRMPLPLNTTASYSNNYEKNWTTCS